MSLITRICTVHRQWPAVAGWLESRELFPPEIAWIFINDAPDDAPPAPLRKLLAERGARLLESPVNLGRSNARNAGTALAATLWIEHLDGDDTPLAFDPEAAAARECDLQFFPVQHQGAGAERLRGSDPSFAYHAPDKFFNALFAAFQPMDWRPASTLWRREALQQLGGYDARFETAEDMHLLCKALRASLRAGHADVPKQIYHCGELRIEARLAAWMGRLRLLQNIREHGGGAPPGFDEEYARTLQLIDWHAIAALETQPTPQRAHFAREAVKHLLRALRPKKLRDV